MGRVYGPTPAQFAADAVRLAVADAGLTLAGVDGLLTSSGVTGGIGLGLQRHLELTDLRLLSEMQALGSTDTGANPVYGADLLNRGAGRGSPRSQ